MQWDVGCRGKPPPCRMHFFTLLEHSSELCYKFIRKLIAVLDMIITFGDFITLCGLPMILHLDIIIIA